MSGRTDQDGVPAWSRTTWPCLGMGPTQRCQHQSCKPDGDDPAGPRAPGRTTRDEMIRGMALDSASRALSRQGISVNSVLEAAAKFERYIRYGTGG